MKTKIYLLGLAAMLSLATCEKKEPEQPEQQAQQEPQAQEYTVTYLYERNSFTYKVVQTVEEGVLLTKPRDTSYYEGFQLQGWSISPDKMQLWNFATDVVSKYTTLFAYYRSPVVFDYRGKAPSDTVWVGSFIPATPQAVTAPYTTPKLDSFFFDGWYSDSSCATAWSSNSHVNPLSRIYAKWTPACTVSYNTQGGTVVAPSLVKENALLQLRPEKPTHATNENLLFWGWYKEPECTNLWDFYRDTVKGNTTLYARWYSIETSGMDFPVHIISCEGKTFKTLKDDLPGLYTWTRDGKRDGDFYNPCPDGWTMPTMNELVCIQNQLQVFKPHQMYWSSDIVCYSSDGRCEARVFYLQNDGTPELGVSGLFGNKLSVRCVKYD